MMAIRPRKGWGALKFQDIERRRVEALSRLDAPNYYNFCVEAGKSREDAENVGLFDQGQAEFLMIESVFDDLDPANPANATIDEAVAKEFEAQAEAVPFEISEADRAYWLPIVQIIAPRFPEGGFTAGEVKERIMKVYPLANRTDLDVTERLQVRDVSGLDLRLQRNRAPLKSYYLHQLRPAVDRAGEEYCPDELRKIRSANAQKKRDAENYR